MKNELQYDAQTGNLNKTIRLGGCVQGFSWRDLIKKFNACGLHGIERITVDEFGLSVYFNPMSLDDASVSGGRKVDQLFQETPHPASKPKKKIR